jgi:5-(carboxyamino)imidazole ribonucleotide mutase
VIGVPVKSRSLSGLDSLLSIVQMPGGVPVATVAINGARNAALLALRIRAVCDPELAKRLSQFVQEQEEAVLEKAARIQNEGWSALLEPEES